MSNWRPEDWFQGGGLHDEVNGEYKENFMTNAYETGADAILDAMWKLAEESPTKTFTIDANCKQVYSQKPPDGCNSEETE